MVASLPVANARDDTADNVLWQRERGALDEFTNDLNTQSSNDATLATEQVAEEKGEHSTSQTTEIPATNDSTSTQVHRADTHAVGVDIRELFTEVIDKHNATDVTLEYECQFEFAQTSDSSTYLVRTQKRGKIDQQ